MPRVGRFMHRKVTRRRMREGLRHAAAFSKTGGRFLVPPLMLCTSREGRIETVFPERVDCPDCKRILATVPADKEARLAWLQEHGV